MNIFETIRRAANTGASAINNSEPVRRAREFDNGRTAARAAVTAALLSGVAMGVRRASYPAIAAAYPAVLIGIVATGVAAIDGMSQHQRAQQSTPTPEATTPTTLSR